MGGDEFDSSMSQEMMLDTLRSQIEMYLPEMEPGSTFLDAGCHEGAMYDILINQMKLDILYHGIDWNEKFVHTATTLYGPRFSHANIMDYNSKFDYVWCSQMTQDDNKTMFRHLCGLARKGIVYTHIVPQRNHEDVKDAVEKIEKDYFKVYIA